MTFSTAELTNRVEAYKVIDENERIEFLIKHVGNAFLKFENTVYSFSDNLIEQYNGGFWDFYNLSNGGFFMALDKNEKRINLRSRCWQHR